MFPKVRGKRGERDFSLLILVPLLHAPWVVVLLLLSGRIKNLFLTQPSKPYPLRGIRAGLSKRQRGPWGGADQLFPYLLMGMEKSSAGDQSEHQELLPLVSKWQFPMALLGTEGIEGNTTSCL